jgi:hypothetical protein
VRNLRASPQGATEQSWENRYEVSRYKLCHAIKVKKSRMQKLSNSGLFTSYHKLLIKVLSIHRLREKKGGAVWSCWEGPCRRTERVDVQARIAGGLRGVLGSPAC